MRKKAVRLAFQTRRTGGTNAYAPRSYWSWANHCGIISCGFQRTMRVSFENQRQMAIRRWRHLSCTRANNNVIWWMGQSGDDGRSWINVFRGVYDPQSNTFTGEWSDVHATNFTGPGNQGTLTLRLNGTLTAVNGFDKVSATGAPFGGKRWFFIAATIKPAGTYS
jgi:hypothetical protein